MKENVPVYRITIDPSFNEEGGELSIDQIAFTSTPAIEILGLSFNKETRNLRFVNELKGIVAAPALQPNTPIGRFDDELGEYYVIFTEQDIELMVEKFNRNIKQNQFNLEHNKELTAPAFMLYNWIVEDPETDLSFTKYGIEGIKKGAWFVVSKFDDLNYFKTEIVDKKRNGFSVEGFFALVLQQIKKDKINNEKLNKTNMKQKFEMLKLEDGTPIWISALEVGGEVYTIDENLDKVVVFDGEHKLENGDIVATVDGKITEIRKPEAAPEEMSEEVVIEEKEVIEEELVEEVPVEVAPVSVDEKAVIAIVQPMIDNLLAIIAELKSEIEQSEAPEMEEIVTDAAMKSSKSQSLSAYFTTKKRR